MPTTYNFTGQRLDSETGLLYYGARYYDPLSGRFTQADLVLNNAEGMDPYAYVGENPESRTDPTGERFISPSGQEAPPGPITTSSPYSNLPTTPVEQQGYAYENVLSPGTAYNGLPLLLNAFLYDHNTWVQAESYAEYQLHSSLLYLLGMQAWLLIHDSGINWNFDNTTRHLFLRLNGLAMAYAMGATGASLDSAGMTDANFLVSDSETTLAAETNPTEGCSFTARTLVTTAQGKQAISKLHVGEKVLAYNPKTHQMELQPILHVWIDKDSDLVDLTLTTVKAQHGRSVSRQSEVIHTNKKHPFFTKERGFLPVGQIKLGMHVLRADGTHGVVTGWRVVPGTQVMYNLEVAQDHTFTVGTGQWVVHNCASSGPGQWEQVNESMSERAASYQTQITGRGPGWAYRVGDVKFDGYLNGVLVDAKGPGYARFVTDATQGEFQSWWRGKDALLNEAIRQTAAAGSWPIEWHVAESTAYEAIKNLLSNNGITGIQVIFTPPAP